MVRAQGNCRRLTTRLTVTANAATVSLACGDLELLQARTPALRSGKVIGALVFVFAVMRALLIGMLCWAPWASAENWPQFRGPRGDGTSTETNVPLRWSATQNVKWKVSIPGEGHSSPVVWERSVFLTSATENGERHLIRVDADTGKILWQKKVATSAKEPMHRENNSASSTPATDGERIITSFQIGDRVDLRCFDLAGRQLWAVQPLRFDGEHGYSYSPII